MDSKNPDELECSTAPETHAEHDVPDDDPGTDDSDLSEVGLICKDILSTVCRVNGLSDLEKSSVGRRVNIILELFHEFRMTDRKARTRIKALNSRVRNLNEQLAILRKSHFGQSSEKDLTEEFHDDLGLADEDDEDEPRQTLLGKRARKVGIDVEVKPFDVYPENRSCQSCGCEMQSIKREERVGELRIVPEHVVLVKNIYHTCACNRSEICKENKPVAAKAQSYIMKGRSLELGFVVEAAVQKLLEHSTLFRMERRLQYSNVNLIRQALGRNIEHVATYLEPVRQALLAHVKAGPVVHMDETPVRVQAPGKGKCDTGYFWVLSRDERNWNPDAQPAVVFEYAPSRAGSVAAGLLSGTSIEYLQTDSYGGYNRLFAGGNANDGIRSVKCWAHARRKFKEAVDTQKSPLAKRIISSLKKVYSVERQIKGLTPIERAGKRHEHSLPILQSINAELMQYKDDAQGKVNTAIEYTLKAFESLQHFVFDGRWEIDNNPVERCIRGTALTKKNSLFAGSHDAAKVWAVYNTLIESAKLNRVNPRKYMNWVAGEIEAARGELDYTKLMPWHCPVGRIGD